MIGAHCVGSAIRRRLTTGIAVALLAGGLGACSGDDAASVEPDPTTTPAAGSTASTSAPAATATPPTLAPPSTPETTAPPIDGPLVGPATNPRYFQDADGRAVFLVGSHTWMNLVEYGNESPPVPFDYDAYLDFMTDRGYNFFRLWAWEQAYGGQWTTDPLYFSPLVYARTGPGEAVDGQPRFDLTTFDDAYFARLRDRVQAAADRGIYVSVMLFNGFSIDDKDEGPGNGCTGHPYAAANNVNGVDADLDGDGLCTELHRLASPELTELQEAYVRQVVQTVGDLPNVVYEISNESSPGSAEWQYHMIDVVREASAASGAVARLVGMTVEWPDGANDVVFDSSADWVSPNSDGGYEDDPPVADGAKVVIVDTDHLWGVGGDRAWVWKSVTRGYNLLYMDCYTYVDEGCVGSPDDPERLDVLDNMSLAGRVLRTLDLNDLVPSTSFSSTDYALVGADGTAVVYAPTGGDVEVDLASFTGSFDVEWWQPSTGASAAGGSVDGGAAQTLEPPFDDDTVVVLRPSATP